jgi:putative membrane protein
VSSGRGQADAAWLRLSPRSLVVRPVVDLARLLPFVLGLLYLHSRAGGATNYWGLGFALLAVLTSIVRWFTTRYRVTDERVYLRHGLLSQRVRSVATDRIRTVDLSAHVLHRMLGLRQVRIGTGRNDRRNTEGFRLDALTLADAEALRARLLPARRAQPVDADVPASRRVPAAALGDVAANAPRTAPGPALAGDGAHLQAAEVEIVRLQLSWVRFAPLTLTGLVIIGVAFGFIAQFSDATRFEAAAIGHPVRRVILDFDAMAPGSRILAGALIVVLGLLLISTAGYVALFWNFRLVRQGPGTLRVTRGLLSTRAITILASRLRGVEISEPLLLRAAGGARCIAITTGLHVGQGAERGGSLLLPPAPRQVARHVAAEVIGAAQDVCAGPLIRHGPRARRRRYVRALAGSLPLIAAAVAAGRAAAWPGWAQASLLVLLPVAAALAADRYRSLGHRLAGGWLVTRTGSLVRRRSILATEGIIGWRIHQSWFQRRQGLVTLTATTAAGRQHYSVPDVPAAAALSVATEATADLVTPFLSPRQKNAAPPSAAVRGRPRRGNRPGGSVLAGS